MKVFHSVGAARRAVSVWRRSGKRIALVPTMGNLHEGHLALMRRARRHADHVIASIFVNPTQFGPTEDFQTYPRTLAADCRQLRAVDIDAVFVPDVGAIYPRGEKESTIVSVPGLSRDLCGAFRPAHFDGVTSVVLRLFNIVAPDVAVFGEKDYQQLVILRLMARDLHLPLRVIAAPTVREADGLAMSSRNQYLTATERRSAPRLHAILQNCRQQLLAGKGDLPSLERQAMNALRRAGLRPDYVAIRSAADLRPPAASETRLRVLAAAWLGRARLIDNLSVRTGAAVAPHGYSRRSKRS